MDENHDYVIARYNMRTVSSFWRSKKMTFPIPLKRGESP